MGHPIAGCGDDVVSASNVNMRWGEVFLKHKTGMSDWYCGFKHEYFSNSGLLLMWDICFFIMLSGNFSRLFLILQNSILFVSIHLKVSSLLTCPVYVILISLPMTWYLMYQSSVVLSSILTKCIWILLSCLGFGKQISQYKLGLSPTGIWFSVLMTWKLFCHRR